MRLPTEQRRHSAARGLLACAFLAWSGMAWAGVARDEVAAVALQQAEGGRLLAIERTVRNGAPVWRVKLVTLAGDVRVIVLDALVVQPSSTSLQSDRAPAPGRERW